VTQNMCIYVYLCHYVRTYAYFICSPDAHIYMRIFFCEHMYGTPVLCLVSVLLGCGLFGV